MKTKKTKIEMYADTIRLRGVERRAMRQSLISFMEFHPLPKPEPAPEPVSTFSYGHAFLDKLTFVPTSWALRTGAGAFALVIAILIPTVAEQAIPGDVLYPVKVRVNEEVKSYLTWTPSEKVAWEVERVERRIAEARLLAKEGKLTEEAEASIAATVKEHTDSAAREIENLRATDADEAEVAEVSVASALEVQSAVLAHDSAAEATDAHLTGIADAVTAAQAGLALSANATSTLAYPRLAAHIETETTRMRELVSSLESVITAEEKEDIKDKISDVDESIADALKMYEAGKERPAVSTLRTALSDVQKLIVFMTDLDVRQTVALETLVPAKMSAEERRAAIDETIKKFKETDHEVRLALETESDEEIIEQVNADLERFDGMIGALEIARSDELFDDADKIILEAAPIALSFEHIITNAGATTTPDTTTSSEDVAE